MEENKKADLLDIIDQQVSSSILGGREAEYEELEDLGYITINRTASQHSAAITPAGEAYLEQVRRLD